MKLDIPGATQQVRSALHEMFEDFSSELGPVLEAGIVSGELLGIQTVKIFLVVSDTGEENLSRLAAAWRKYASKGTQPPVVLTRQEITASLDAYPVEFLEMKLTGKVVVGEYPLDQLEIRRSDLRVQCERELRGLLIHTRLVRIAAGNSDSALGKLLSGGANKLMPILRGVAVLAGGQGRGGLDDLLAEIGRVQDLDIEPFKALLDLALEKKPKFTKQGMYSLARELDKLVHSVDKLNVT